nr:MAG TPA: hypothetical protein [Caudoviricetes sp.]
MFFHFYLKIPHEKILFNQGLKTEIGIFQSEGNLSRQNKLSH